jgi:hypothetical protein
MRPSRAQLCRQHIFRRPIDGVCARSLLQDGNRAQASRERGTRQFIRSKTTEMQAQHESDVQFQHQKKSQRCGRGRKRTILVRAVIGGVDVKRRRCLEALHAPQPVCDGAEVALHDAGQELVPVMLRHTAPTVVNDRDQAEQQSGQGAAAAQELQPPVAGEALALQGAAPDGGVGQHGAEQRRVIGLQQSMHGQAAAADDEKSGCGDQH